MSPTMLTSAQSGASELTRLAEKLIRRLGIEDALRVCQENSWYGVLRLIQGRQNDGTHI